MATKIFNSSLDIKGNLIITQPFNSVGTILTFGSGGIVSTRTNAEIISDLGLIDATNIASLYYTKSQLQTSGQSQVHWENLTNVPTTFTPSVHNHDDRYYTETESDNKFIPYTGATQEVNLNTQKLRNNLINIKGEQLVIPNVAKHTVLMYDGNTDVPLATMQTDFWNGTAWQTTFKSSNGFGMYALQYNTGTNSNGLGMYSLQYNTGISSNGFGYVALQYNTGISSNGFGYVVLRYNNWNNSLSLGHYTNYSFNENPSSTKNFNNSNVSLPNLITITSHGFGAVGRIFNLKFKVISGTAPAGLAHDEIAQFEVIDANTLKIYRKNITTVGSGSFSLTNSVDTTGSILVGHGNSNTKSYQAIWGHTSITETIMYGIGNGVGDFVTWNNHVLKRRTANEVRNDLNVYTKTESLNQFVGLTGAQTIADTKTFTSSPVVPNPTLGGHAVNKSYLEGTFPKMDANGKVDNNMLPKSIKGKFIAMGGEVSDTTITGFYDRNQLCYIDRYDHTINVTLGGAGIFQSGEPYFRERIFNGKTDSAWIVSANATTTLTVEVILSSGNFEVMYTTAWQAFVAYRLENEGYFKNCTIEIKDGTTGNWVSFVSRIDSALDGSGIMDFGSVYASTVNIVGIRFSFANPVLSGSNIYMCQLGFRKLAHKMGPQFPYLGDNNTFFENNTFNKNINSKQMEGGGSRVVVVNNGGKFIPVNLPAYNITNAQISNWDSASTNSHTHTNKATLDGITPTKVANWDNAYSWGNHAGLYKPNSYVPTWAEITSKPSFHAVATSGNYNDLINKPDLSALSDVKTYANLAAFPVTGVLDRMYIANDTGYMYRWNGSGYTQLTDQTAIWGQIGGSIANQTDLNNALNVKVDKTTTVNGKPLSSNITLDKADVGLDNVDNTADVSKEVLSATKLKTARTINGVSFDGTANITIQDSTKVISNSAITGATKTKVTYDAKGLVTGGADATTNDIVETINKRYQTDNQKMYNDATSSIQTQLDAKEPSFTKNAAFNKNFGISAGTVSEGNHTHSNYVTTDTNQTITGNKKFTDGIAPVQFWRTGYKSWTFHRPTSNSLILTLSTSNNSDDWDWSKQIELKDNGNIKANGFELKYGSAADFLTGNGAFDDTIKLPLNVPRNNLGKPTLEEISVIHGQLSNKLRFIPATLQEESTDGSTWTTSTRNTPDTLAKLMLGEGQTTLGTLLYGNDSVGTSYRLTWDVFSITGYMNLSHFYAYMSTNGNRINIKIEALLNSSGNWEMIANGDVNNWPGHVTLKHTPIWYNTADNQYKKVRVTFTLVTKNYPNNCNIYGIEWLGSYPAGKRNVESYDINKNVIFPNKVKSANGFEVVGKDDSYLVKAGGGTEKADNFRDKLVVIDNDTTTIHNRTEQTTNVIIKGVWGSEVTLGLPNVNAGHTVNLVRIDTPTSGYYTDIICDSTSITNMVKQRMTLISDGTNWIDITDWKDIMILY